MVPRWIGTVAGLVDPQVFAEMTPLPAPSPLNLQRLMLNNSDKNIFILFHIFILYCILL